MQRRTSVWLLGAGLMAGAAFASEKPNGLPGENPNPIHLIRRPMAPLSAMAKLGRDIFFDASLSSSGKMSCASCHSPEHAYGPPNDGPVMLGGPLLTLPGVRAVPSLTYLERQPDFSIGPEKEDEDDNVNLAGRPRPAKRPCVRRRVQRRRHKARISCRRAACSGTAAPIPFRTRHQARCSIQER